MKNLDIIDPGTLRVLCQINAIADHVSDPAAGFTMDDMRAVSERLERARLQIEGEIALKICRHTDAPSSYWEDIAG